MIDLIIKSLSPERLDLAKAARVLLEEATGNPVLLVPQGVKKIKIFEDEDEYFSVSLWGDDKELDLFDGFLLFKYAHMYAMAVAKEAGLDQVVIEMEQPIESMEV